MIKTTTRLEPGPRVYGATGTIPPEMAAGEEGIEIWEVASLEGLDPGDPASVLLLSGSLLETDGDPARLRALPDHVVVVAVDQAGAEAAEKVDRLFMAVDGDGPELRAAVLAGLRHSQLRQDHDRTHEALEELNKIGMALMSERNPDNLLNLILTQARRVTTSDAGSLYLVEKDPEGEGERLHFRITHNDSLPHLPTPDFTLPMDQTSVAGYAALAKEPLVLEDAYEIPEDMPFTFNTGFDQEHGYRAKSMLVVPMVDHQDRVVGVLQLLNRKRNSEAVIRDEASAEAHVLPYREQEVETVRSLAGQAAVSIENGQLYQDIKNLFDGFITAAVTAIDQRDPTTSGHSVRVTELTCDVAELINAQTDGPFADVHFPPDEMRQLRYAGLLHDFGKVGVREEVLVKERKLPPAKEVLVEARFGLIRQSVEAAHLEEKVAWLEEHGPEEYEGFLKEANKRFAERMKRLDTYVEAVRDANMPRVLEEDAAEILDEIAEQTFRDPEGNEQPYLTEDELHYLRIPRGTLDDDERAQIQSHVTHSYDFLLHIPWTDDLSRIAEIVRGHHEKLDGSGYPDGVTGDDIPLETRIMTVADIFDALTASDRPYKKAMPVEKALKILGWEAEGGQLDPDIVELFVESEVYRKVLETDWRKLAGM